MKPRPTPLAKGKPISGTHLEGNLRLSLRSHELCLWSQTFCNAFFVVWRNLGVKFTWNWDVEVHYVWRNIFDSSYFARMQMQCRLWNVQIMPWDAILCQDKRKSPRKNPKRWTLKRKGLQQLKRSTWHYHPILLSGKHQLSWSEPRSLRWQFHHPIDWIADGPTGSNEPPPENAFFKGKDTTARLVDHFGP